MKSLGTVLLLEFGHMFTVSLTQPLVSLYVSALGGRPETVGFVFASFGFIPMLLSVPMGIAVGRMDVRRLTVVGVVGIASALAMLGFGSQLCRAP